MDAVQSYKVCSRLRDLAPAARGSQEVGFMQPRANLIALYVYVCRVSKPETKGNFGAARSAMSSPPTSPKSIPRIALIALRDRDDGVRIG